MSNEKRLPDINEMFSAWLTKKHEAMKAGEQLAGDFDVPMLDVLHESTCVALSICGHLVELGLDRRDPSVLEGMFLAIQMMGGPAAAAQVVGYCSAKTV